MVAFGLDGDLKFGGVDGLALSDQHDVDQLSVSRAGSVTGERARHGDELVGEVVDDGVDPVVDGSES
jgi:hypothetical protein|tara:strand:+ start:2382 stop:2582 length:201 start_codon:yes stop_codon:yes gene_type:complete